MNDDNIKRRVKDAFEQDVPDVLSQIKASPEFRVPPKESVFSWNRLFTRKAVLSLTSVIVITLIIFTAFIRNNDPVVASTITLEVNPSIQITLDEDDKVITVTALSDDGEAVVSRDITYLGMSLDEVLEVLIARLEARGYLVTTTDDSNIILIDVTATNETIRNRVETALRNKLNTEMGRLPAPHWVLNARDIPLTEEQRQAAMEDHRVAMYTRAKMMLIYRIHALDDSYTVEDLIPLTIRELYRIFIELEDPDNLPEYDEMPGHHPGGMPFGGSFAPTFS